MTQQPTFTDLPPKRENESDNDYNLRIAAWIAGEDVRVKTDLKDWTGSPTFHLNVERD
jgi:hypothetical protein